MRLRNHDTGYGLVTRSLHWATLAVLVAQVGIGYLLDVDDSGRGRGRGRGGGSGRGRGRGGDEERSLLDRALDGDDLLLSLHVALGLTLLLLAVVRLVWRRVTPLPPWAECLSERERTWAHWTERVLYLALLAAPLSGLLLVLVDDDFLALHVTSHVVLYGALASHLALVLRHTAVRRDGLLRRML
jgi:cytochrome b561